MTRTTEQSEPTLFGAAPAAQKATSKAPHNGTDTSKAAARAIEGQLNELERLTLRILESRGSRGATNEEISELSEDWGRLMTVPCVCGRVNKLRKVGAVVDSRQRRPGRSGRAAKVWTVRGYDGGQG